MNQTGETHDKLLEVVYLAKNKADKERLKKLFDRYRVATDSEPDEQRLTNADVEVCSDGLLTGVSLKAGYQLTSTGIRVLGLSATHAIKSGTVLGFYRGSATQTAKEKIYSFSSHCKDKKTKKSFFYVSSSVIKDFLGLHLANDNPREHNVKAEECWHAGVPLIVISATKDIAAHQFLSLSYDSEYWVGADHLPLTSYDIEVGTVEQLKDNSYWADLIKQLSEFGGDEADTMCTEISEFKESISACKDNIVLMDFAAKVKIMLQKLEGEKKAHELEGKRGTME